MPSTNTELTSALSKGHVLLPLSYTQGKKCQSWCYIKNLLLNSNIGSFSSLAACISCQGTE